jgi:hypothetical protein
MPPEDHSAFEQDFSDHYERTLAPARQREVDAHLGTCAQCRVSYEKFRETLGALSGLHKMAAPDDLGSNVTSTINRRSAGRFFGRKAFGDRVPFEAIAVVALVVAVVLYFLLKTSSTGTLHEPLEREKHERPADPGAQEVMPKP